MLVNKGSVYDLATIYVILTKKNSNYQDTNTIISKFCNILDKGYTYNELRLDILNAIKKQSMFSFNKYNKQKKENCNLLKQGVMYYHKELKLMNSLPTVNHDINNGTITNNEIEYYLEPVASYTIEDLLKYFYSKNMADVNEYNHKRMAGIFKHIINKYGIDKTLFMIEHAARLYESEHKVFSLSSFESYNSIASQYLEEIKNNCKYSGGDKYVLKRRVLPC